MDVSLFLDTIMESGNSLRAKFSCAEMFNHEKNELLVTPFLLSGLIVRYTQAEGIMVSISESRIHK
jgi:hypothetical protein